MNDVEAQLFLARVLRCPQTVFSQYISFLREKSGKANGHQILADRIQSLWREYFTSRVFKTPEETFHFISEQLHPFDDALVRFTGISTVRNEKDFRKIFAIISEHLPKDDLMGYFLSEEAALRLLGKKFSKKLLRACGGRSISEALGQCDVFTLFSTLRFMENEAWMDDFLSFYTSLSRSDFERRSLRFLPLSAEKWGETANAFAHAKLHPFSHLKELGVIFFVFARDRSFAITPFLLLLLHYIYEVRFYSSVFRSISDEFDFGTSIQRIISGDTPDLLFHNSVIPILQQYHLKKSSPQPFAFLPHVHSESLHWEKVWKNLTQWLFATDCGDFRDIFSFFPVIMPYNNAILTLNPFDIAIDRFTPKLYHAHEALWNALFSSFFSSEKLEMMIQKFFVQKYISFS